MCGIIGYLDKRGHREKPVGQILHSMLQALSRRGPDSVGVAVFGTAKSGWVLQVNLPEHIDPEGATCAAVEVMQAHDSNLQYSRRGAYLRIELRTTVEPARLERLLRQHLPGAEVVSFGHQLEIVKQVGSPSQLEEA
jgi:methylamine---glutamate N-methyltransferase subunit A